MESVSFHRLAENELHDAAIYYEIESHGLGDAFLDEVAFCMHQILDHPEAGAVQLGPVRRRLLRRFPYAILYSIKVEGIRILAVMNVKRRPMYWIGRE